MYSSWNDHENIANIIKIGNIIRGNCVIDLYVFRYKENYQSKGAEVTKKLSERIILIATLVDNWFAKASMKNWTVCKR